MGFNFAPLKEQLLQIRTLHLSKNASNFLEKLIWIVIAIFGTTWFCYFINFQFEVWRDDGVYLAKADLELSDINYPAITFCSQGANKLGIVEGLGNYIDPDLVVKNGTLAWIQEHVAKCAFVNVFILRWIKNSPYHYYEGIVYEHYCLTTQRKKSCEVLPIIG